MKKRNLLVIFLLLAIILIAGCTGPVSTVPTTPVTAVPDTPAGTVTATPPLSPVSTVSPVQTRPVIREVTGAVTSRISSDVPFLEHLDFQKQTLLSPIPSCVMQNAFPAIANDGGYGIKQEVPRLFAISEDDYITFIRKYTEGNSEKSAYKTLVVCQGSANEPTWNFVEVRVVLNPTNVQPSNYTVTRNVWSDGKLVAQIPTTEHLVIDQKASLVSYIPVRTNEMDFFDSVAITTDRL